MSQFFWKKSLILQPEPPEEGVGIKTLGDIEFMSIKEFQGKVRQDDGTQIATGDIASITASGGKDMYLAKAKVTAQNPNVSDAVRLLTVELSLNGIVVERWQPARVFFGGGTGSSWQADEYEFVTAVGRKVLAGEIIKLAVTFNTGSTFIVDGAIEVYEEDTGTTPQIAGSTGSGGVGDIGFLALKDFENKLRIVDGPTVSTTGVGATITANPGKDMYLAKAQAEISLDTGTSTEAGPVVLELRFNGIVVDTKRVMPTIQASEGGDSSYLVNFDVGIGKMVATGQVIDINILTNNASNSEITSSLEVWEEDTGESPVPEGGDTTITGLTAGDFGFMAQKEFEGKLVQADGSLATTGDLAVLTANTGKDLYLARAQINFLTGAAPRTLRVRLLANGVIIEDFGTETTSVGLLGPDLYTFNMSGIKVLAGQIIKLEVATNDNNQFTVFGSLLGWEEDSGTSPTA